MAITKKERAEFDAAILKASTLAALRWTSPVEPDLMPPTVWKEVVTGWLYNSYNSCIYQTWSTTINHGSGDYSEGAYASQKSVKQYSTRILALKALRYDTELKNARELLRIDKMIDVELNEVK